ncbi:hypothetical protein BDZ91DRAFT_288754 [Kalaharituber pfeilii]|nr:hypothetical protein BDZ91DRAFT_288754 [Kalaharituber pfeilii]
MSKETFIRNPFEYTSPGDVLEPELIPSFMVIAWCITFIGALAAIELLARRTSSTGLMSYLMLFAAAFCMGPIGLWGMFNMSERAITFGWHDLKFSIVQAPYMTVITFFTSFVSSTLAYWPLGTSASRPRTKNLRVVVSGTLAGLVAIGNHYLSLRGITSYDMEFYLPFMIAAGVIPVIGNIMVFWGVLSIRECFKQKWNQQILWAILLAGAINSMQWVVVAGTTFYWKKDPSFAKNYAMRELEFHVLKAAVCIGGAMIIFLAGRGRVNRKKIRAKASKISLAVANFTLDGRLMVKPDGTLPTKVICDNFNDSTFDEAFEISHPIFQWIYRASQDWKLIVERLPSMLYHRKDMLSRLDDPDLDFMSDGQFSLYFRESFALTACKLAESIGMKFTDLGGLYEKVYQTANVRALTTGQPKNDLEKSMAAERYGRGRLLILTRIVSDEEAKKLRSRGLKFGTIEDAIEKVAWATETSVPRIANLLTSIWNYNRAKILDRAGPGIYIGCFAIRPTLTAGFEILVDSKVHSQVPMLRIPVEDLLVRHVALLRKFDGFSIFELWKALKREYRTASKVDKFFLRALSMTIRSLTHKFPPELWKNSFFIGKPAMFPCANGLERTHGRAMVFALRCVLPVQENVSRDTEQYDWIPTNFLSLQQKVSDSDSHHFHQAVLREFTTLAKKSLEAQVEEERDKRRPIGLQLQNSLVKVFSRKLSTGSRKMSTGSSETDFSETYDPYLVLSMSKTSESGEIRWNPKIPEQEETKDDLTWVDHLFRVATEEARRKFMF